MADNRLSKKDVGNIERLRVQRRYDAFVRLGSLLIGRGLKWGFFAWLAYQAQIAVSAFAGRTTLTNVGLALGANITMLVSLSWTVTVGFGIWVFLERRLRKGTVERLTLRIKEMEITLDRDRSSSLLTTRGDTRPEDQV